MGKGATYKADPCKNCGGVKRYVSNRNCPTCQAESQRLYKARKAASEGRSYTPRRVAPPMPVKPLRGPEIAPNRTSIRSLLDKVYNFPLSMFQIACKSFALKPV